MDTLPRLSHRLLAFLLLALPLAGLGAWAESPRGGPQHVVLRNGQVMTGEITLLGDRTLVRFPQGGEVTLPSKDILFACHSLTEAYHQLAERIAERRTATPFIELARWCLRHELLVEAAEQLELARQRDTKDPSLAVLQRQLDRLERLAAEPPKPTRTSEKVGTASLPAAVAAPVPNARSEPRPTRQPTTEELEESLRSIPKEAVEMFVGTVQPLMWNKCGTNRCHDTGGPTDFRIPRPVGTNQVWRRLSLRNLHTVLLHVDRDDPDSSPLLVKSREPHADLEVAPLGGEESLHYQQLLIWVRGIAGRPVPSVTGDLASSESGEDGSAGDSVTSPPRVAQATFDEPVESDGERPSPTPTDAHGETAPYQARDPFDPEVFNRRYLKK